MYKFKLGDLVTESGVGLEMTVVEISPEGDITCGWWEGANYKMTQKVFKKGSTEFSNLQPVMNPSEDFNQDVLNKGE